MERYEELQMEVIAFDGDIWTATADVVPASGGRTPADEPSLTPVG